MYVVSTGWISSRIAVSENLNVSMSSNQHVYHDYVGNVIINRARKKNHVQYMCQRSPDSKFDLHSMNTTSNMDLILSISVKKARLTGPAGKDILSFSF